MILSLDPGFEAFVTKTVTPYRFCIVFEVQIIFNRDNFIYYNLDVLYYIQFFDLLSKKLMERFAWRS